LKIVEIVKGILESRGGFIPDGLSSISIISSKACTSNSKRPSKRYGTIKNLAQTMGHR
jgi:hypothetical protein